MVNTNKEMTKAQALALAIELLQDVDGATDEMFDNLNKIQNDLNRKRKTSPKVLEQRAEDERTILDILDGFDAPATAVEIIKDGGLDIEEYSPSKVVSILTRLIKDGKVVKTTEKKKSYYAIVR